VSGVVHQRPVGTGHLGPLVLLPLARDRQARHRQTDRPAVVFHGLFAVALCFVGHSAPRDAGEMCGIQRKRLTEIANGAVILAQTPIGFSARVINMVSRHQKGPSRREGS
jgi:hypothetical protein